MPRAISKHYNNRYQWSIHNDNVFLRTTFWPRVKEGIVNVAKDLKITISEQDMAWLEEFNGQYCKFMPKDSRYYNDVITCIKNRGRDEEAVIEELRTFGCIVGKSPRYSLSNNPGNTDFNYETQLRLLWNFLSMVGSKLAYSSMLILLIEKTTPPPPAVDAGLLTAFINHRWLEYGTPLNVNGSPIMDVNNCQITCEESLSCPNAFTNFWAALSNLHMLRGNEGNYTNQCPLCNHNYTTMTRRRYQKCNESCIYHPFPTGMVTRNLILSKLRKDISNSSKAKSHKRNQRDALLPQDMLNIHKNIERNNFILEELRNYLMILLSLDSGLRYTGHQRKTISNFNDHSHLWKITDHRIIHLAHSVIEKKDDRTYTYKLHFKEVPKLCALRHLLVYVHCSSKMENQQELFPTKVRPYKCSKGKDQTSRQSHAPLSYKDLYNWLKEKINESCEHATDFRSGTHVLRRTFYQFSAISIAVHKQEEEITERMLQQHARHRCAKSANLYMGDARLVARTIAEDPEMLSKNPVPKFREILLVEEGRNLNRLHQLSQQSSNIKTISQAAKFFVNNMLCVLESSKYYTNISYLLKKSYNIDFTSNESSNPVQDFLHHIRNTIPRNQQREMEQKFTSAITYITQLSEAHNTTPSKSTTALLHTTRGIINPNQKCMGGIEISNKEDKCEKESGRDNFLTKDSTAIEISMNKKAAMLVPYINGTLYPNMRIPTFRCLEQLTPVESQKLRRVTVNNNEVHYKVAPAITRLINQLIRQDERYTAAALVSCVIIEISNINRNSTDPQNITERYSIGKKRCTKLRHLTTSVYDRYILCLKNCYSYDIHKMTNNYKQLHFQKIKNGYKFAGCNSCYET